MSSYNFSYKKPKPENSPDKGHFVAEPGRILGIGIARHRLVNEPSITVTPLPGITYAPEPLRQRQNISAPLRWYTAIDAVALLLGFIAASWLASYIDGAFFQRTLFHPHTNEAVVRAVQSFIIACAVLLSFEHKGHYRMRRPFWLEVQGVFGTLGLAMAIDGFIQFASHQDFSRICLILGWAFSAFVIIASRSLFRAVMRRLNLWQVRTLLVGTGTTADDARAAIHSEPSLGYVIAAQIGEITKVWHEADKSWEQLCARYNVDYVVIALDGLQLAQAEEPIAELMRENIPFSVSPPLRHVPVFGMTPQHFFNHDVMLLTRSQGLEEPLSRLIKRGFDIVAACAALLILSPLFLLIAGLIKLDGGPIFFYHKRIGFNKGTFRCFKFRSMVPNGNEVLWRYLAANPQANIEWRESCKLREDPRVTYMGHFLRRYSLDELPQLINVLRGDMSLVGPRPIAVNEIERYENDIAYYVRVRPGITGVWQVSGRSNVSYEARVQMDVWYVRNWSFWHDLAILCKTLPALMTQSGAY